MLKSKEIADSASCLNKAADDEPVFVLRAKDQAAPGAIRDWAAEYYATSPKSHEERLAKTTEALACAAAMEDWYKQKASK